MDNQTDNLVQIKKFFPDVSDRIAKEIILPTSSWHEITINCLGWVERYPEDTHLIESFKRIFISIKDHHLGENVEAEDEVEALEKQALLILDDDIRTLDRPLLIGQLISRAMDYRRKLEVALKKLFCCLIDFEYGFFDAELYVAMHSLSITVGSLAGSSKTLREFGRMCYESVYEEALKLFLKESSSENTPPKICPYEIDVLFDRENFHDKYGRALHLASLDEPDFVEWRSWKK